PWPPGECPVVGRGCGVTPAGRVVTPWQRHIDAAPLLLEAVRAAARTAPAEVEHAHATGNHLLHECRVQEHVRGEGPGLAHRTGPRHFELIPPHEAAPAGERLVATVDCAEHHEMRKRHDEALQEGRW